MGEGREGDLNLCKRFSSLSHHCVSLSLPHSSLASSSFLKDQKIDGDDPEHLSWLFKTATARANEFDISGVTYTLTQGVVKNIIPAIASTNSIVAGE